ncbi:MAG: hypothetical protein ACRDYC_03575, partial [Acidimicrobiales bacterium]
MPGMGTGIKADNPTVVAAFYAALGIQGLIVAAIALVALLAWMVLRARANRGNASPAAQVPLPPEPAARRLLRISFGVLWLFDGLLQAQASMPLGMAPEVIRPAAASSPLWVQQVDNAMATIWSYHPVSAPAAAVWIQLGLGAWLLVAPRGTWSRLAGVASAGWGVVVWVFGEAFGQLFAPGVTWLFGAPGAVAFYSLAGVLIALRERSWATPRLGRFLLRGMGAFFVGMAVLQAWPGRGFWQGRIGHQGDHGMLSGMLGLMAQTPQPGFLASWVSWFERVDSAHGFAVNLIVVIALAGIGAALLYAHPRWVRWALVGAGALCLADWVLVEDLGFVGGVGTDPNSMIPMFLVLLAGYFAITRIPGPAPAVAALPVGQPARAGWRVIAAVAAVGVTVVGAAPMAYAASEPYADPILSKAVDGAPQVFTFPVPAPQFSLVDQRGTVLSPASWPGRAGVLTYVDPACL